MFAGQMKLKSFLFIAGGVAALGLGGLYYACDHKATEAEMTPSKALPQAAAKPAPERTATAALPAAPAAPAAEQPGAARTAMAAPGAAPSAPGMRPVVQDILAWQGKSLDGTRT